MTRTKRILKTVQMMMAKTRCRRRGGGEEVSETKVRPKTMTITKKMTVTIAVHEELQPIAEFAAVFPPHSLPV